MPTVQTANSPHLSLEQAREQVRALLAPGVRQLSFKHFGDADTCLQFDDDGDIVVERARGKVRLSRKIVLASDIMGKDKSEWLATYRAKMLDFISWFGAS